MNKLLIVLLLLPLSMVAQKKKKAIGIPYVNARVLFDSTITVPGKDRFQIYNGVVKFCKVHDYIIDQDPQTRQISAMGHATCPTPREETIRYHIFFSASDSSLRVVITNITFKRHEYENEPAITFTAEELFAKENYYKPNGKPNPNNERFRNCTWALVSTLYQKSLKVAATSE